MDSLLVLVTLSNAIFAIALSRRVDRLNAQLTTRIGYIHDKFNELAESVASAINKVVTLMGRNRIAYPGAGQDQIEAALDRQRKRQSAEAKKPEQEGKVLRIPSVILQTSKTACGASEPLRGHGIVVQLRPRARRAKMGRKGKKRT